MVADWSPTSCRLVPNFEWLITIEWAAITECSPNGSRIGRKHWQSFQSQGDLSATVATYLRPNRPTRFSDWSEDGLKVVSNWSHSDCNVVASDGKHSVNRTNWTECILPSWSEWYSILDGQNYKTGQSHVSTCTDMALDVGKMQNPRKTLRCHHTMSDGNAFIRVPCYWTH